MHISFIDYLVCPKTKECLQLTSKEEMRENVVITGTLSSSKYRYPIIRGIPRFLGESVTYTESFGYEWNKWGKVQFESENIGRIMEGHTKRMFEKIWGFPDNDFTKKILLDVGCGSGRFIEVVRLKHGKIIGIDYSSAVESARRNFVDDVNVLICQADALSLPIRSGAMDGVYSIGVLHHTPDPETGFMEMVKTLKDGGKIALSVYGKGGYYDSPRVSIWRNIFKILRPALGNLPPLLYAYVGGYIIYPLSFIPILGHFLRLVYPTTRIPDLHWRVLDIFDSVTPTYQSTHESFEVFSWFKRAGLKSIEPSNWGFTSYHGQK